MSSNGPTRGVDELVDRQFKRWIEEERRRAHPSVVPEPARHSVTISREAGSNGTALARRIAAKLGFRLWDQELVQRIAEKGGASETLFAAVDERPRGAIQDLL